MMNSDHLARYYETLTPWERLPLLVDASARNDQVEEDRLARSAPKHSFRVPDFWGLAEGLDDLAKLYLLEQLDLAVVYWRLTGLLGQEHLGRRSSQERQREKRQWKLVKMLAYRFVVLADGWRLLCIELNVNPDALLRELTGYDVVKQMEEVARLMAYSAAEALAYLRSRVEGSSPAQGDQPAVRREYRLDTAADVAQSMRAFLQARLDWWQ
jgi:hypothetical protein